MGRPAHFSSEQILEAALRRIVDEGVGAATMSAIAADIGAPSGSVYHRFASREVLLATLWLDVVEPFQAGFLAALDGPDPHDAGRQALRFTLEWCWLRPMEARLLLLHRVEDLLAAGVPAELRQRANALTDAAAAGLRRYAYRRFGSRSARSVRLVQFGLVDLPSGALRRDLAGGTAPSREIEELILVAYDAAFMAADTKRGARAARSK